MQTRIGDETITLRLAKVEEAHVVPWAAVEDNDSWKAWALSEVSVRKALCETTVNPPTLGREIEVLRKGWSESEKEIPILVLESADQTTYKGTGRDPKSFRKDVFYSSAEGLRVSS